MSLRFELDEIKDYQTLCWLPKDDKDTERKRFNPVTESLIHATMAIDMGEITEKNHKEFFVRLDMYQHAVGPFMHRFSDDKKPSVKAMIEAAEAAMLFMPECQSSEIDNARIALKDAIKEFNKPTVEDVFITYEDVKAHIGLHTNVSTKSRAAFIKKIGERLMRDSERTLQDCPRKTQEVA